MNVSILAMMTFARSGSQAERREFFVTWLKDHFQIAELDTIEKHLQAEEKKGTHSDELGLVRAEYLWCINEPLEKIRRLGCADANQLTEGKC